MCLHWRHGFVRRLPVPILLNKLFGTCHRSEFKRVSTDKPILSSISQRETKRQRVKCHMRAHTVAEPSDIQQKVH